MLVGVVAFNVLRVMDPADQRAIGVLLAGYFFQGLQLKVTVSDQFYSCSKPIRPGILYDIFLHLHLHH
jgi:hypothetical protein